MKKILLATELTTKAENILQYAIQYAAFSGAALKVLHVVTPQDEGLDFPVMVLQATEVKVTSARARMEKMMERSKEAVKDKINQLPAITSVVEVGSPTRVITQVGRREEVDLIMVGTRGESRTRIEVLMGSVAAGVVRNAQCAVLTVPEEAKFNLISVVTYATDLMDSDPYEIWKMIQFLKPFIPVVHVVHVDTQKVVEEKSIVRMEEMKAFYADHSPAMQIQFHRLTGKNLIDQLNDFAFNHDSDLLAMYQPPHNFWDTLFHKSQTKKMALYTKVPLLVLKEG